MGEWAALRAAHLAEDGSARRFGEGIGERSARDRKDGEKAGNMEGPISGFFRPLTRACDLSASTDPRLAPGATVFCPLKRA